MSAVIGGDGLTVFCTGMFSLVAICANRIFEKCNVQIYKFIEYRIYLRVHNQFLYTDDPVHSFQGMILPYY